VAPAALATSFPPDEINRLGFHLYARLQPETSDEASGWGAKRELKPARLQTARF